MAIEPIKIQTNQVGEEFKSLLEGMEIDSNPEKNMSPISINDWADIEGLGKPDNKADKTGDNLGGKFVVVEVGEDIQAAIDIVNDAGGGKVFLKNGTHTPNQDLTMYSNIYLEGQNSESAIIDLNGAYSILIKGSNGYTTGTVSVSNGGTTVTGVGTSWTSAMVGRDILLSGIWYPISAVASGTSLTISLNYASIALSGATYAIATRIDDCYVRNLTIKDSTTGAIEVQYGNEVQLSDLNIQTCTVGIDMDDTSNAMVRLVDFIACGTALQMNNVHYTAINLSGSVNTTSGNGFELTTCSSMAIDNNFILNSAGDGIQFTDCKDMVIKGNTCTENGGQGFELISGNEKLVFIGCAAEANGSDGIKLTGTSDRNIIMACVIKDNSGNAINIAAADCDNNIIANNFADGEDIVDNGTGTQINGNV